MENHMTTLQNQIIILNMESKILNTITLKTAKNTEMEMMYMVNIG